MLVLNKKELIFYFIDKVKSRWSREDRRKLHRLYINVVTDGIRLHKGRKTLGYFKRKGNEIVIYAHSQFVTNDLEKDLEALENLIEHELRHAISKS